MDASPASDSRRRALALVITGAAVFMVTLDNLVVTNALPSIRADLGASISQLGWFVNAYTLTFAALLLTGASLGDRFGRRRVFALGLAIFTAGSLGAALATSSGLLITARSVQGLGAALVMPLSLTLLSAAFPADRRGLAIGIWSGLSGLAVALGPVVGGAVVDGLSWQWIFFLNVPIGILLAPFAYRVLDESHGPDGVLDVRGLVLASTGLLALVWGIVRGNDQGWLSPEIVGALALARRRCSAAFVAWERRAPAPMLPLRLFRSRAFSATNGVSLIMNFGIFGSIFLLAQFLQTVQGYSAFDAGVRTLPWTLMPMFVAPLAGLYSDRIGSRPLMFTGLALQATALGWLASVASPTVAYSSLIAPFVLAGIGMALVFAPVSNMILSSVSPQRRGQGQRRQQRDPRGRRHARRRRARERVQPRGQRAHRPGLRRRPRAGRLDRGRRARRRRAARPGGARAAARAEVVRGAGRRRPRARVGVRSQRIVSTKGRSRRRPGRARGRAARTGRRGRSRTRSRSSRRRRRARGRRGASPAAVSASSTRSRPRNSARRPLTRATVGAERLCGTHLQTERQPPRRDADEHASRREREPHASPRRDRRPAASAMPRAFARTRSVRTI